MLEKSFTSSPKKPRLGRASRELIKMFPAKVQQLAKGQYGVVCVRGNASAFLHDSYGSAIFFSSPESAQKYIDSINQKNKTIQEAK